ncbi:MAG: hypothetical protein ACJ79P_00690 [Myxococcales bacterium]
MNVRVAVVLALSFPAVSFAQPATRTAEPVAPAGQGRTAPEMNGHVFMPSALVDTPFRETTFKLGLLYGLGTATGPQFGIVDGKVQAVGQADYTFADFAQTFRYEYRFAEWLSLGAVVLSNLYSGIDGPSAVNIGAEVGIGFGLRARAGHRFGPVETAIIVDASTNPEFGLLVFEAIRQAILNGQIQPGATLQTSHSLNVNPEAAASWAPFPALGITVNAGYLYKSLRQNGESLGSQDGIQAGAVLDFDFGKISSVPIGLVGGYRLTAPLGDGGVERIDDIEGGIFYTGRRELGLGMEIGWRDFTIRPPLDSKAVVVQLSLQYYW